MRLVLDSTSAHAFWMSASATTGWRIVKSPCPQLTSFDGKSCSTISNSMSQLDGQPGSLDLLVSTSKERRTSDWIHCRTWGDRPLPPGSLYEIGDGLFVVSPELCLVRLAVTLPRLEFLRAMTDLVGIYSLSFSDRQDLIQREPLTNKEKISSFLDSCKGIPGASTVRRALNWIPERSASPRETSMDLELALPTKLGGQGMPPFKANHRIDMDPAAAVLTTKSYLVADVAWVEEGQMLEYNSSKFHDDENQKEFDFEKITALRRMEKTVTPVSTRQYNSYPAFSSIVDGLRKSLGVRDRCGSQVYELRSRTHSELLRIERKQREEAPLIDQAVWRWLYPRLDSGD